MKSTLANPPNRNSLSVRAADFALAPAIDRYEALIERTFAGEDTAAA